MVEIFRLIDKTKMTFVKSAAIAFKFDEDRERMKFGPLEVIRQI